MNAKSKFLSSAIYEGNVRHRRYSPKAHTFNYKVFMVYLDLQEIDVALAQSRWWSVNSFNLATYRRSDYFDGKDDLGLYDTVANYVKENKGKRPNGPIRMLTNLRYFGYIINPITCYYCFDKSGTHLETIVAEVTNTPWKDRIHYILDINDINEDKSNINNVNQTKLADSKIPPQNVMHKVSFKKEMHVSPFHPMDLQYNWIGKKPGENLFVHIDVLHQQKSVFDVTLNFKFASMNKSEMRRVIFMYPLMTIKVFLGIHWQAVKLFFKRIPFYSNPDVKPVEDE